MVRVQYLLKQRKADNQPIRTRQADKHSDADPEFLALTNRQRAAIDRAFNRGLATVSQRAQRHEKRRRIDPTSSEHGEGGSIVETSKQDVRSDEQEEGGFIPDDEGGFLDEAEGGFLPEDEEPMGSPVPDLIPDADNPSISENNQTARVPLHLLPTLLTSLGLPSDSDVLSVFRSSASGWDAEFDADSRRRKRGEEEAGVERKDFRAVCAALMGPDENEQDLGSEDEEAADAFTLPDDSDSSLSPISSESSYGGRRTSEGKQKATEEDRPAKGRRKKLEMNGPVKLSTQQKEAVRDIWEMLKPPGEQGKRGHAANILGKEEVKKWARALGEMWSEDELSEMVTLFSTQHEQRGLSFDDFSAVMLRAGLV
ncbi:hypothetical protein M231_01783 [Tremella mesenterica]|uniref:EF-hand domain-containing protein n=1 Tax=Tremella mesenterica TaxID=5217 RepID=A0A4Q1BSD1_TREME|nr:hypothetical protein M231_01783 [Tremella mesenterica]